jgi:DNA repair protein RecN (Recombination protein N)
LFELREAYSDAAEKVRELRRRNKELSEARQNRQRELALIRFEREELDTAALKGGELESIQKEREKLLHAQSLAAFTASVADRLVDDEGSVAAVLGKLSKEAGRWAGLDRKLAELNERLAALKPEVQDLAETCRDLSEAFEADPERLDAIERRLQTLHKLEAKYGQTIPDLIAYRDGLDAQERKLQGQEDDLAGIENQLRIAFTEMKEAAAALSKARAKVAKKLAAEAQKHLADLNMEKARLDAILEPIPLGSDPSTGEVPLLGADHLELMLTANPGEPSRPLRKVAPGGELSRAMLALKTVLAAHDPVRTLVVFDEIDANVGGRLGDVLGHKLAALGATHQVLCVTHLPQVASYASHQWTIRKQSVGKRTTTTIAPLGPSERVEELAIMLRGEARSETTRKEAAEMLKVAGRGA